jgi:putative ABC transport system ATP-binding protein
MTATTPGSSGTLELRGVTKRYGTGQDKQDRQADQDRQDDRGKRGSEDKQGSQDGQVTAADNVTFTIEAGAFVALTGASGSGKSTLLHMIGAIERPDSGTIITDGTDVTALHGAAQADYRRTVGFVFQRYNLLPALTALDNVIAPVLPYRTPWDKRQRARDLLAAVGLAGRERSLPARMSGGEQQRIAIARALINTPALLLADEPTGNLDTANATAILDLLARLRAEHHMTILLASHDPQIAARSERLIRLRDGAVIDDIQLIEDQPAQDIIRHISQLG